jgi:hypothetical protein
LRSSLLEKRVGKVLRRSFLEKSILLCRRWKCQRYTVAALRSSQRTAFRSSPPPKPWPWSTPARTLQDRHVHVLNEGWVMSPHNINNIFFYFSTKHA